MCSIVVVVKKKSEMEISIHCRHQHWLGIHRCYCCRCWHWLGYSPLSVLMSAPASAGYLSLLLLLLLALARALAGFRRCGCYRCCRHWLGICRGCWCCRHPHWLGYLPLLHLPFLHLPCFHLLMSLHLPFLHPHPYTYHYLHFCTGLVLTILAFTILSLTDILALTCITYLHPCTYRSCTYPRPCTYLHPCTYRSCTYRSCTYRSCTYRSCTYHTVENIAREIHPTTVNMRHSCLWRWN